jgi:hypothetical protein
MSGEQLDEVVKNTGQKEFWRTTGEMTRNPNPERTKNNFSLIVVYFPGRGLDGLLGPLPSF